MKRLARYLRAFFQRPVIHELDALRGEVRALQAAALHTGVRSIQNQSAAQADALAALSQAVAAIPVQLEALQRQMPPPPASHPTGSGQRVLDVWLAGFSFKLDNAVGNDNIALQAEQGIFEAPLPSLLAELLARTSGDFIDVGAHTGVYSILACLARPDLAVVAFEPMQKIREICRTNLEINGLLSRVDLRPFALSNRSGVAQLHIPNPSHGLLETSASLEPDFRPKHSAVDVAVTTLDELHLDRPIAVIKVDIEGHEHAFLAGARKTIARARPIIIAEVLPAARFDLLQAFVAAEDYRNFRVRPDMVVDDYQMRFDGSAWNHALVPSEQVETFRAACKAQQLEIVVSQPS